MAWQDREKEWKNLQAVQQKLGEVSMVWAMIDRRLDSILTDMLDISHAEAAVLMTGVFPARKCKMISGLITISCPSREWGDKVTSLLNEISNKFGEERNRIVHDIWRFEKDKISRINATAKAEKTPHQGKRLVFDRSYDVTIKDLENWCARGYIINMELRELRPALLPWLLKKREELSR